MVIPVPSALTGYTHTPPPLGRLQVLDPDLRCFQSALERLLRHSRAGRVFILIEVHDSPWGPGHLTPMGLGQALLLLLEGRPRHRLSRKSR
eukprot:3762879-Rhodomonas_salina.1